MDQNQNDAKIDELTRTVNRLSQQFEDYMAKYPPPGQQQTQYPPPGAQHPQYQTGVVPHQQVYVVNSDTVPINGNAHVDANNALAYNEGHQDFSKDENEARGNWSGKLDFLLACLGYAVGLGNVWRFPYLCYKNGGAIFFIPYVIMLFFVGMPIFFFELSLGQFTSAGPLTCWNMAPVFKGIGVGMTIVSFYVGIYYNMIIAWSIWYTIATLVHCLDLPWQYCNNDFNTRLCYLNFNKNITDTTTCDAYGGYADNTTGLCLNGTDQTSYNMTEWPVLGYVNETLAKETKNSKVLSTEEYLNRRVWGKDFSDGIGDMGEMRWELVLSLILAWVIVCASLIKGVKSSGKVVYFTALFPYAVLIILLIRGVTLEGHLEGVRFYIAEVDVTKLYDVNVWKDAANQIFFSLSASWGGLITLASYNRFHNDCLRDSLIVSLGNCLTSFFAGFVIFSFLGFLAHELDTTVEEVAESGVGLAFIVYPDAVTRMPVAGLWAFLFFAMLITLGLDSEFALVETVSTAIMDQFPVLRKNAWWKAGTLIVMSVIMFLLGLPMCCNGGAYVLQLMDHYSGGWNVFILALCECLCIAYIYGLGQMCFSGQRFPFYNDIMIMIGRNGACSCCPWLPWFVWWSLCWLVFTPVCLLFVLIYSLMNVSEVTFGDYEYPQWSVIIGWCMTISVIAAIFVTAIIQIIIAICKKGCAAGLRSVFVPNKYWGPALPQHRALMQRYRKDVDIDPWNKDQPTVDMGDIKIDYDNPGYINEKL
jgi:solute carrier family 6 amino acid transporter-like protein 5/7/9/14